MSAPNSKNSFEDALPVPTLRDVLSPLFRHHWLVIGSFCLLFLCTILFAWRWASHYYVAKMQVVVEPTRSDPAITSAQNTSVPSSKSISIDQISSEIALLRGQDMFRTIVVTCDRESSGLSWCCWPSFSCSTITSSFGRPPMLFHGISVIMRLTRHPF